MNAINATNAKNAMNAGLRGAEALGNRPPDPDTGRGGYSAPRSAWHSWHSSFPAFLIRLLTPPGVRPRIGSTVLAALKCRAQADVSSAGSGWTSR